MEKIKYVTLESGIQYDWDDYEAFGSVLYDVDNDTIITKHYGHGSDLSLDGRSVYYETAIDKGIVSEEQIKRACLKSLDLSSYLYRITQCVCVDNINVPCSVNKRCRSIKGDVILLSVTATRNHYGWGRYHEVYDHNCLVYSPSLNQLATINCGQLSFSDEVQEMLIKRIFEKAIEKYSIEYLAHAFAYQMSYASIDSENYQRRRNTIIFNALPFGETPDYSTASFPQKEAKKAAKMTKLIEWAKSVHPEYDESEIMALAEKVWNKKYGDAA